MRKLIFILSFLIVLTACARERSDSARSNRNLPAAASPEKAASGETADFSFEKLVAAQNPAKPMPAWSAPRYNGLLLGKAVEDDVSKMFGEPHDEFKPFSEYESTDDEWIFHYENINNFDGTIDFVFDVRSKVLKEVWLQPNSEKPLTIDEAIRLHGSDYFVRGYGEKVCSPETPAKLEYPFTIVYPHKGIFLWVRDENFVDDVFYAAKCPQ